MVARHRLVQEGVLHLVDRPRREAQHVGLEEAGAAAVECAGRVVLGVVAFVGFHRTDAVGQTRQLGEQARQFGIDALGDVAVGLQHLVGLGEVEALVGLDALRKFASRALEADLRNQCVHRALDPRHFAQAQVVHLLRRQRRGGHFLHRERVVGVAARQQRRGERSAARRQVFLLDEALELRKGRLHLVGDRLARGGLQAQLVGLGEVRRERLERCVQRTRRRVGAGERVELRRDAGHRFARRHPARLHAGAHQRGQLLERERNGGQALQIVVVVARVAKRARLRQRGQAVLRPGDRRDHQPAAETIERQRTIQRVDRVGEAQVAQHQRVRDAVLRIQSPRVEALQLADQRSDMRLASSDRGGRPIAQPVVVIVDADEGRVLGRLLQFVAELALEQRLQRLVRGWLGRRRREGKRRCDQAGREQQQRAEDRRPTRHRYSRHATRCSR